MNTSRPNGVRTMPLRSRRNSVPPELYSTCARRRLMVDWSTPAARDFEQCAQVVPSELIQGQVLGGHGVEG
ncbi:hypothetical protein ACEN8K_26230 [Variovorax sp. CT11-76]